MNNYIVYIQKPKEFVLEYWIKHITHGEDFILQDILKKNLSEGDSNVVHYNNDMAMICFRSYTSFHILLPEIKSKLESLGFKIWKIIQVSEFFSADNELMTLLDQVWFKKENSTIIL